MSVREGSTIGLLLSGGMDSGVLLKHLLECHSEVVPFYVRTGCVWQECELRAVESLLQALRRPSLQQLRLLDMPLADLYGNHWSISGNGVPDAATPDRAVFLPGRNPLLLLKPALWCRMHSVTALALATLAANPFDDATPEFFARFETMLEEACGPLKIVRPFERLTKREVLELGRDLPLELTFSCLSPVGGRHCGRCNKCAERKTSFSHLGVQDPTKYVA
jgi:7-cyano-7-deazaguanine synthase